MDLINNLIDNFLKRESHVYDQSYNIVPTVKLLEDYYKIERWFIDNLNLGDRVALTLKNDYYYLLSILAAMRTGRVFIPMRNDWPIGRINQVQEISNFKNIIDEKTIKEILNGATADSKNIIPEISKDETLYIMFTSGSTGQPKGVEIHRNSYSNFLTWIEESFEEINEHDKLLNSTHYTFDVSLMELGLFLVKNVIFYCSNIGNNPLVLARELSELKITVSITVPNNFNLLLSEKIFQEIDLSNLKSVLLAGSRFPVSVWDSFKEKLPQVHLYNCFGPTEATIYCLYKKMSGVREVDINDGTVSIGQSLTNLDAQIMGDTGHFLSAGEKGELVIGGIQVMSRYINSQELTEQVLFKKNDIKYYRTGDVSFKNSDGDFFVVGRIDDTIKISGQRVNLSDIDGYLLNMPEVKDCATVAIKNEFTGYQLISFIVLEVEMTVMIFKNMLKEILLPFQIPSRIIFEESLPLNNSGKIDKKLLTANLQTKSVK